jgi:hypothetical protein
MKKFLCSFLAMLFLTSYVFSLDTDLSGAKSYTFKFFNGDINTMKYDKYARDRYGYSQLDIDGGDIDYADTIKYPTSTLGYFNWGLSLDAIIPINEMFTIGFYGLFNNAWSGSKNQVAAGYEQFKATRINDEFQADLSIALSDKFTMGVRAGGGVDYDCLNIDTIGSDQVYDIYGNGYFLLSYGFTLKSDNFNGKLNDLKVENTFTFSFGDGWNKDYGYYYDSSNSPNLYPILQTITTGTNNRVWKYQTRKGSGAYTDKQSIKYFGFRWISDFKEDGVSVPLKDYISGLDRFDLVVIPGMQLDTKNWYEFTDNAGTNFFYSLPVRIYARPNIDVGLRFNGAGFENSVIWGNDIKVTYETYSYTKGYDIATTKVIYKPSLEIKTKKLFTVAAFPFIPWIGGSAKWVPSFSYTINEDKGNSANPKTESYSFAGQEVYFNVQMGMKFDNLELEFMWLPSWSYGGTGTSESNIWSLANWKCGVTWSLDVQKK